jgi:hypothetical protein
VFFVCGVLSFSLLNVVTHSLQRLIVHLSSIQIYPSGRRARSPIWDKVSVLFSVLFSFSKQENATHFFLIFGLVVFFVCGVLSFSLNAV